MKTFDDSTVQFDQVDISFDGYNLWNKLLSEGLSFSDFTSKNISKTFQDVIDILDSSAKNFIRSFSEFIGISDNINKSTIMIKQDALLIADFIKKSSAKVLSSSISLADSILKGFNKFISETLSLTDIFSRTVSFLRTFVEEVILSDSLRRYLNGIEQIWNNITRVVSTIYTKKTKPSTDWTKRDKPWKL